MFWCTKSVKFHFWWGVKPRDKKQETGNDCNIISGLKASWKQISQTFPYFLINNALLYHPLANWLAHNKICFSRILESWNDVTIVPSLLFLVPLFCTPLEVKFDAFGTSKLGEGKSLSKILLCYTYQYIEEIKSSK